MKNLKLLIATCFLPLFLFGQEWPEHITFEQDHGQLHILEVVDIDQDGDLDVFTIDGFRRRILWYEQSAQNGTFNTLQVIFESEAKPRWFNAADIDNDGDQDLIITFEETSGENSIKWLENMDGQGTFGSLNTIDVFPETVWIRMEIVDLDQDGTLDVLLPVRDEVETKLIWYKNFNSASSFERQLPIIEGGSISTPLSYNIGDIDGDTDIDILTVAGEIKWYENDGNGLFENGLKLTLEDGFSFVIETADIDGDDDLDILSYTWSDSELKWSENLDGEGTYSELQKIAVVDPLQLSPRFVDLDNDGDQDILFTQRFTSTTYQIGWFENLDGQGTFALEKVIHELDLRVLSTFPSDLDQDDDADILAFSVDDYSIFWLENNDGQANFDDLKMITHGLDNPLTSDMADIDGDGHQDLLVLTEDGKISWFENIDGQGTGGNPIIVDFQDSAHDLFLRDMDSDGDQDIVVQVVYSSTAYHEIIWYENLDGQGAFGEEILIAQIQSGFLPIFLNDFEGDGDIDFVGIDVSGMVLFENIDGLGQFGEKQVLDFPPNTYRSVDVDQDGDQDFISTNGELAWFEQLPDNNWSNNPIKDLDPSAGERVWTADLSSDGKPDIILSDFSDTTAITWYEYQSDLNDYGQEITLLYPGHRTSFLKSGDMDLDGDQDLVLLMWDLWVNDRKIVWFENTDGQGAMGEEQLIAKIEFPELRDFVLADMDGDNDLDVAYGKVPSTLIWFENPELTSVAELPETKPQIALYPNPFSTSATIEINGLERNTDYQLKIVSLAGQLIREYNLEAIESSTIEISHLPTGMYIYQLISKTDQQQMGTGKMIVVDAP